MPLPSPTPIPPTRELRVFRPSLRAAGRFVLTDGIEHRCQVIDISGSGVALRAAVRGSLGETVICYLDGYGRLEGRVARHLDDGFAVALTGPAMKRERLARQLAWQAGRLAQGEAEVRRHDRIEPVRRRVVVRPSDGRLIVAEIINLSRSGAALTCPGGLTVGQAVTVGRRAGCISRATQLLVAVEFETPLTCAEFTPAIIL